MVDKDTMEPNGADDHFAAKPIFVHSMWRCASTYLFNVFRRSPHGYWAYQEPIHEVTVTSVCNPSHLLEFLSDKLAGELRHPILDKPYFQEIFEVHDHWKDLVSKCIVYDQYFESECTRELSVFISALLSHAKGRPVIQECRTASRVGALKRCFGGTHIYAWRNPRDQWWSYKINDYFDTGVQLIVNANPHPEVIDRVRTEIGFQEFHSPDIEEEFRFYYAQRIHADHSYLAFYVLWALGWKEGSANADVCLNVDQLARSGKYRELIIGELGNREIEGLDFSDCRIHAVSYSVGEDDWFSRIEERALGLLMASGWSRADIENLTGGTKIELRSAGTSQIVAELREDISRSREVALRLHDRLSDMAISHRRELSDKNAEHMSAIDAQRESSRIGAERAELLAAQQSAAVAAELAREHKEDLRTLQNKHVEAINQAKRQLEDHLRTFAQREREHGMQLLAVQQQAATAAMEQARRHEEEVRTLQDKHTEDVNQGRRQLEDLYRVLAQREQEVRAQLLALQQQAASERAEQASLFIEREGTHHQQLDDIRRALRLLEVDRERLLELQREHNEQIHRLDQQLGSERAAAQESLGALRAHLAALRNSLSWRYTAPFRAANRLFRGAGLAHSLSSSEHEAVAAPPDPVRNPAPPSDRTSPGVLDMSANDAGKVVSPSAVGAVDDLKSLLQHQDRQFIECAYLTLLKREPDPQGLGFYLGRLRGGEAKLQIVSELYSSMEARQSGADLPWLRSPLRRQRLTRLPVLGILLKTLINRESKSELGIRLRVLEQKVFLLEQLVGNAESLVIQQRDPGSPIHSNVQEAAPNLSGLPMAAKRIFRELSNVYHRH
jgi:Domain of unknown function (DUF4214)